MVEANGGSDDQRLTTLSPGAAAQSGAVGIAAYMMLFALPAALLVWRVVGYFSYAAAAVANPYGIDFAEGIVWQQLLLIPGPRMYGDIHTYPYIVFHYTPLFHLVVRLVAEAGADILAGGRLVSVLSILVTCGAVAMAGRRLLADQGFAAAPAWFVSILAGLLALTFRATWYWSVLLKSDALALALTLVGFVLMLHAARKPVLGHVAMVFFVLAVYTKQILIACPTAALLVWLVRDPRSAVRFGATGLVLGGGLLVWLVGITNGGFLRHIFLYNVNPFSWRNILHHLAGQRSQGIYPILAALAVARLLWWGRAAFDVRTVGDLVMSIRSDDRSYRLTLLLAYFVTSSVMIVAMGKEGASINYLMEWFAVATVGMAALFGWSAEVALPAWRERAWLRASAALCVPLLLSVQLMVAHSPRGDAGPAHQARFRKFDALVEMVRTAPGPVLSDEMVLLMRAGREVPLESAIFFALSATGVWDQRPFVEMLASGVFAFVITEGDDGSSPYEGRYTPQMRQAIRQRYPAKRVIGAWVIRFPSAELASVADARLN